MRKLKFIQLLVLILAILGIISCMTPAVTSGNAAKKETKRVADIEASLKKELADLINTDGAEVYRYEGILIVTVNEQFLFDGESATLKNTFEDRLIRLSDILKQAPDKIIRVVGHTAVWTSKTWASSWDLGAQRAVNVVRFMQEKAGIDPHLLIAETRGEYEPFAANDNERNRQKNRRVEFILMDSDMFNVNEMQKVKM